MLNLIQEKKPLSKVKHILAVAAGKGGVGKSTVSVHLALALKELGLKVGLLDADIYGPSIEQMLPDGMEPTSPLDDPETILPALAFGIPTISIAHFKKEASMVRAPVANKLIEQFLHVVEWGELDVLIVDFPPGTGDIQLTLMQKAPISAALLVTTPQVVATLDVRKAIQLFQKMEIPLVGVLENMSYLEVGEQRLTPFGKGGGEELVKEFDTKFLGQIPIEEEISLSADRGESLFDRGSGSDGARVFHQLAMQVKERLESLEEPEVMVRTLDSMGIEVGFEGSWHFLSLSDLQRACPCASCEKKKIPSQEVSLLEFSPVGRYAMRFTFSSGCSQGIYPLQLLKQLVSL